MSCQSRLKRRRLNPSRREAQGFSQLLRRRAALVHARVQLQQSLKHLKALESDVDALLEQCTDQEDGSSAAVGSQKARMRRDLKRCQAVPGTGPLTAVALTAMFHQRAFRNVDGFIAFLGMDVRVRQAGCCLGQRKLTNKGDKGAP
jgi:transposase